MQVLKFGGSSVANATNISRVLDIVGAAAAKDRVVLVCSAIKGCTDALLELARLTEQQKAESTAEPEAASLEFAGSVRDLKTRHLEIIRRLFTGAERADAEAECHGLFAEMAASPADEMVTFGEIFSTRIIARKLACDGIMTKWLDSRILVIKDNKELTYSNISAAVALHPQVRVFVAPGFVASTYEGKRTTLGRGGSDLSASIFAAALRADSLQIWTDVPGIMTANPKDVPQARTVAAMSYRAALEMASSGAKVLYAPSVKPAMEEGIRIQILNTFAPEHPGTVVGDSSLAGWAGVASAPCGELAAITLVAEGSFEEEAASLRLRGCLRKAGILPLELSAGSTAICFKVRPSVENAALCAIHREFFENAPESVLNLYIAGFGAVGKAFVELLGSRADGIAARSGRVLRIAGLANSRTYVIDPDGINPAEAAQRLAAGTPDGNGFAEAVRASAPRRSIFVDLTDSETIWKEYTGLLRDGINIVTSNRRALSVPFADYSAIMSAAAENGCFVRHETTVGSALPMLGSLSASANAGEEIVSLEAVVSCTLNRILSSYARYPGSFAQTVRKAQEEGLTETDPRTDLAGRDALRKLLILAREAGIPLEESDVEVVPAVPSSLFKLPLEEFYRHLEEMEPEFEAAEKTAAHSQCRQRFIATLELNPSSPLGYRAVIAVRNVPRSHPAFRILGTENAIILRSALHPDPLVIQGPGEGARMAAGSVLNDILK